MPRVRGKIVPGEDLPVPRGRERVRFLVRRVFLRERFTPLAVQLNVTDASRRSPGGSMKPKGRMRMRGGGWRDAG